MQAPIYDRLAEYRKKNRISFAMPGHKSGRGLGVNFQQCDVTELKATLNLYGDDDTVKQANSMLSDFYGTRESFILPGGSTGAIQTMLASVLKPGDTLLATSDCHMSVINTCAILGVKLKILQISLCDEFLIPTGADEIELTPDISAVLLTSPNYYGITKNIRSAAEKCRKADIPLLVDEAHGAHFTDRNGLPQSAVGLGADLVCQSAHKTLNALTGGAYLHICTDRVESNRVKRAIRTFHSSSPSYPISASADYARAVLEETDYSGIIKECTDFKNAISRATNICVFKNDDPTRVVLNFREYDIAGQRVSEILSERYGIDIEMADLVNIVLIATPENTHADFMALFHALCEILSVTKPATDRVSIAPPPTEPGIVSPQRAWFEKTKLVDLKRSVGYISAATVTAYPPGAAIIVTGGRVSREAVEYMEKIISEGADTVGVTDGKIEVVDDENSY